MNVLVFMRKLFVYGPLLVSVVFVLMNLCRRPHGYIGFVRIHSADVDENTFFVKVNKFIVLWRPVLAYNHSQVNFYGLTVIYMLTM